MKLVGLLSLTGDMFCLCVKHPSALVLVSMKYFNKMVKLSNKIRNNFV